MTIIVPTVLIIIIFTTMLIISTIKLTTSIDVTLCISTMLFNTLRLRQYGRHFSDDSFKCIFLNENVWISIKISLKFVPKGLINNIPALVQIMAWRHLGNKPLSEPMMVSLLTHIWVTCPQWVNSLWPSDAILQHSPGSRLPQIMASCLAAPSHYLSQCWLIIKIRPSDNHFTRNTSDINHQN